MTEPHTFIRERDEKSEEYPPAHEEYTNHMVVLDGVFIHAQAGDGLDASFTFCPLRLLRRGKRVHYSMGAHILAHFQPPNCTMLSSKPERPGAVKGGCVILRRVQRTLSDSSDSFSGQA